MSTSDTQCVYNIYIQWMAEPTLLAKRGISNFYKHEGNWSHYYYPASYHSPSVDAVPPQWPCWHITIINIPNIVFCECNRIESHCAMNRKWQHLSQTMTHSPSNEIHRSTLAKSVHNTNPVHPSWSRFEMGFYRETRKHIHSSLGGKNDTNSMWHTWAGKNTAFHWSLYASNKSTN